ncbi:triose-phosphate isomerase [Paracraurococcus ruber]|uniref:Triosephosphate isomerase n=1 Tax=Paracraurococcus ruber TaxID=77675 RepID=A0ABS1CZ90_9PROT|nr:triose-phosphate isomerase [Paracraurococcus ruber]MBK1659252.1 triose-phosphate isomerase [Paracraurococcus ruber]TDG29868.1 triose-phosphate isomerase [Paracraurococcus ruber]
MTPGVRPLIAGNWKMHGTLRDAAALAEAVRAGAAGTGVELLVCPPFPYIHMVAAAMLGQRVAVGAQDCHAAAKGAHTGDVAAPMLADIGARYVILGHSERRADHAETDAAIRAKAEAALAAGLTPIICVGESEAQRLAGDAEAVVTAQLAGSLPEGFARAGGVVAYEPVWAIGTGRTPTEPDIAAIHAAIRADLVRRFGGAGEGLRILYGGSVKPANAAAILALPHVDGALVGGASLVAADFLAIAAAAG